MKRLNIRSIIWTLLIGASLASYIYLNSKSTNYEQSFSQQNDKLEAEEEREASSAIFLPDVALVKKILNITKIVLPEE